MTATAFDTHKAAKTLTKSGVTDKQADAHVEVLMQVTDGLATKNDLVLLKNELTNSLTWLFGGMMIGAVALITLLDQVVFK